VTGGAVFIELIGIIVDRLADFIEKVQGEVDELSHSIFGIKGGPRSRKPRSDLIARATYSDSTEK
jgi:hypothetical protein